VFALMLDEVIHHWFKRSVQSITYLLYFLSWAVFGGIIREILAYDGAVNSMISSLGVPPVLWLTEANVFRLMLILTDIYKNFGWGAVVYLAALTNVDPSLREAAAVDGADRLQRIWHISLPAILPTIVLMAVLSLGSILSAGMEQVLVLYSPAVYKVGDIVDTFIYREGFRGAQFAIGAAIGLVRSLVGMVLIALSFYLAKRFANYRIL
jgi:putative aldouronate transport system permease protein